MSEIVTAAPQKEVDTGLLVTGKNPRGIPEVVFIVSSKLRYFSIFVRQRARF